MLPSGGHLEEAPKIHCLTLIDPATCWFEIAAIDNKSSIEIANELEITWLTRYPAPSFLALSSNRSKYRRYVRRTYVRVHTRVKLILNPRYGGVLPHFTVFTHIIGIINKPRELHKNRSHCSLLASSKDISATFSLISIRLLDYRRKRAEVSIK